MSAAYPDAVTDTLQETSDVPLEIADRCDRCGAQAKNRVTFTAGTLLFCSHHFNQHAEALARAVAVPRSL